MSGPMAKIAVEECKKLGIYPTDDPQQSVTASTRAESVMTKLKHMTKAQIDEICTRLGYGKEERGKFLQAVRDLRAAVDGKLNKTVRRMQEDNAALRKETHDLLAELEQLTLQMYEEHEAALTACREAQAAQRSGLEGLGETQRATFDAQQAQIDALGAVVRKQQGMIDELTSASAVQMASAQAALAEGSG